MPERKFSDLKLCIYAGCEVVGDMEEHAVRVHGASPPMKMLCNWEVDGVPCTKRFDTMEKRRNHRRRQHGVG